MPALCYVTDGPHIDSPAHRAASAWIGSGTRNDQLRLLGNGCVPQQVHLALRLLAAMEVAA